MRASSPSTDSEWWSVQGLQSLCKVRLKKTNWLCCFALCDCVAAALSRTPPSQSNKSREQSCPLLDPATHDRSKHTGCDRKKAKDGLSGPASQQTAVGLSPPLLLLLPLKPLASYQTATTENNQTHIFSQGEVKKEFKV